MNRRNHADAYVRERLDRLLREYTGMDEVVAVNGILADRIMYFSPLDGNMLNRFGVGAGSPLLSEMFWSHRWEYGGVVYNPDYDSDTSSTQPYPIVASNNDSRGQRLMVRNGTQQAVPIAFSCRGVGEQKQRRKKWDSARICSSHEYINLVADFYDMGLLLSIFGEMKS